MALITQGSFDDLTATFKEDVIKDKPALRGYRSFSILREATREVQPEEIVFEKSIDPRGIALKSIKLLKGFEGILGGIFNKKNEVFFTAMAWDLSGNPVVEYPGKEATAESCLIPLKVGDLREFLGAGIALFPARIITAGITLRIFLWESDAKARAFGKSMVELSNTIKTSKLNNLISALSLVTGATTTTVTLIKDAAVELMDFVGRILQANSNDYVDFYEGYFPVSQEWIEGTEHNKGYASEIELTRLI
jgi:hypothetical protein